MTKAAVWTKAQSLVLFKDEIDLILCLIMMEYLGIFL